MPNEKRTTYSETEVRAIIAARLEGMRREIEEAILRELTASLDEREANDPEYSLGLHLAIPAGVSYGIAAIRLDDGEIHPIPTELLSQARTAARQRVPIEAVIQRYIAAQSIFDRIVLDEARTDTGLNDSAGLLTTSASLAFQALVAAVGSEYARAVQSKPSTRVAARVARLERLLDGERARTDDLEYDFSVTHIAAVAEGSEALGYLRHLASALDGRLLTAQPCDDIIWAWIGLRQPPTRNRFLKVADDLCAVDSFCGFGELSDGMGGWRRTHEQARAAFAHVAWQPGKPVHYADIAIAHSVLQDHLLGSWLYHVYLAPLEAQPDRGATHRSTLTAYFEADRNAASAAERLGVNRRTISNRLKAVESQIGRPITDMALELQIALSLAEATQG